MGTIYDQVGQFKSVRDYDHEALADKANQLQMLMHQQQFDVAKQGVADQNALREATKQFGADPLANVGLLRRAGLHAPALALEKSQLEARRTGADIDKTGADTAHVKQQTKEKAFEYYQNVLGTITDPAAARNFAIHSYTDPTIGPELQKHGSMEDMLARMPTQLGPAFDTWKANAAIGIKKMAEMAKVNNVNLGGTMATQVYQPATGQLSTVGSAPITQDANSVASNATSRYGTDVSAATTRRGQNMTDARAGQTRADAAQAVTYHTDGDTGQTVALPSRLAPGVVPTAREVTLNGAPLKGPGGKLGEGAKKQVTGIDALHSAIDEYKTQLKGFKSLDALSPDARAAMGSKYNNMMLQAKEAYNLGVLNGPDYDILTSVVTDPLSMKGAITSNAAMEKQASELDRMMQKTRAAVTNQGKGGGAAPATPAGPKPGTVDSGHRFKGGNPADPKNWEPV